MKKPLRLFQGCNVRSLNPQLYESFQEALAEKTLHDRIHPKDITFMKAAVELYTARRSYATLRELVAKVGGSNLAD
tara:strand:+ start:540 stop:767 length:228 start_codon:yes stop_codon:yes gene_type:complete